MDRTFIASNLKHLRNKNNITQEELAKACNKQNTAISNWESGTREPNAVDLSIISQLFHVTVNDLILKDLRFDNADVMQSSTLKIPVLGVIKAGIPIEAQQDIKDYVDIPEEWTKGGKKFYGLVIKGDSMFPKYNDDDIVIFESTNDFDKANGKDCAVMVNGFDATFKNVTITSNGILLTPLNLNNIEGFKPTFFNKNVLRMCLEILL